MNLKSLKEVLLAEHFRERKIFLRNVVIALFFWIVFVVFIYFISNKPSANSLIDKLLVAYKNLSLQNEYYKYIVPIAFLSTLSYPIMLYRKYTTRPKKIDTLISLLGDNKKAEGVVQFTSFMTTVPLLVINLKVDPALLVSDDKTDDALFVSFLESMLKKDPNDRATVVDLLDDTWLTQDSSDPVPLFESSSTFS